MQINYKAGSNSQLFPLLTVALDKLKRIPLLCSYQTPSSPETAKGFVVLLLLFYSYCKIQAAQTIQVCKEGTAEHKCYRWLEMIFSWMQTIPSQAL